MIYRTPWWLYLPPFWPLWVLAAIVWIVVIPIYDATRR